jgi:hypothetical protein
MHKAKSVSDKSRLAVRETPADEKDPKNFECAYGSGALFHRSISRLDPSTAKSARRETAAIV